VSTETINTLPEYLRWAGLVLTPAQYDALDPEDVRRLEAAAAEHAKCRAGLCAENCQGTLIRVRPGIPLRPGIDERRLLFRPTMCDRREAAERAAQVEREVAAKAAAEAAAQAEAEAEAKAQRLHRLERLPPLLRTKTLATFTPSPGTQAAYAAAVACAADTTRGLVLAGPPGTGKTHLGIGVLLARIEAGGDGRLVTVSELLDELRRAVRDDAGDDVLHSFKLTPLLVLDDLGVERTTEFAKEQLFSLLNARLQHMRQTLVTTNYETPSALIERLGGVVGRSIVSRLRELADWVVLKGPDYRVRMASLRGTTATNRQPGDEDPADLDSSKTPRCSR
jgi:DNA replication protein DnaC